MARQNLIIVPPANAEPKRNVNEGDTVALIGTASVDPDGGTIVAYEWSQIDATSTTVTLDDIFNPTPSFIAPAVTTDTTLTFSLMVTDNNGGSSVSAVFYITLRSLETVSSVTSCPQHLIY